MKVNRESFIFAFKKRANFFVIYGANEADMGCGFSTEDNQKAGAASEDKDQRFGVIDSSLKKSPSSKSNGKESTKLELRHQRKMATPVAAAAPTSSSSSSTSVPINSEISSSQVNFFKMLDEKIEQGFELEETELEDERHIRLQKVAEEWPFGLLGRSQDSNDLRQLANQQQNIGNNPKSEDEDDIRCLEGGNANSSSVDSMRTMFSNSVNLPAGTLREVVNVVSNNQEW